MRLWSLHPRTLDRAALGAVWREGLLARKVLLGQTRGYRHHPQLTRFRDCSDPIGAIDAYLHPIHREAAERGYSYNLDKLGAHRDVDPVPVTTGQLEFELLHLREKVSARMPDWLPRLDLIEHPLFIPRSGPVESWERP